jgi:hypothetical protein
MVNKMADGRMKLRAMGITEGDIANLREHLDNRFVQLADWLQDEYLVKKREEYNKVHERMFGAAMANIENYFPLKLSKADVEKDTDVTESRQQQLAATITGAVVKRTKNAKPIDITANAFDVVLGHLQDMEHWAAWGEWNRDLNTLRNYKTFRNRLRNMSSLEFGSGEELLKNFDKVCAVATGTYGRGDQHGAADKMAVNVAKGVTAAKISFRIFTALKQLLSLPAFWNGDARVRDLAAASVNLPGTVKWAMENLPGFSKRWQSRQAGDARLVDTDSDFSWWHKKWVERMSRAGMFANASMDALACAMGAKAVYETKKRTYLKRGYTEEQAEQRALQDASISFNASQQSSENAFVSAIQQDRTWYSVMMTVFRTASTGYTRRVTTALRNLKYRAKKGYKDESIAFMAKEMVRDGLSEEQALTAAKHIYARGGFKSMCDVLTFGFALPFFWNLGPYMAYLLWGDDDDEKKAMWKDSYTHALFGPIEGITGGDVISDFGNALVAGDDVKNHDLKEMPIISDFNKLKDKWDTNKLLAANDLFNLLVQAGVGVNPQTLTDMFVAGMDFFGGEPDIQFEWGLFVMRVLQVPQSALDKVYIDELGMTAGASQKLSADQLAARYARYKGMREGALSWWIYNDEARNKVLDKYEKRFAKDMKTRMEKLSDSELENEYNWAVGNGDGTRMEGIEKLYEKKLQGMTPKEKAEEYNRTRGLEDSTAYKAMIKEKAENSYEKVLENKFKELTPEEKTAEYMRTREISGTTPADSLVTKKYGSQYASYLDKTLPGMSLEQMDSVVQANDNDMMVKGKVRSKIARNYGYTNGHPIKGGSTAAEYNNYYIELTTPQDDDEDARLAAAKKEAKEMGDESLYQAIDKAQRQLTGIRKWLVDDEGRLDKEDAEMLMEDLRAARRDYLRELGIMP